MIVKIFRLNFILVLLCFFSFEIAGFTDPNDGLSQPDLEIENEFEIVHPVSYKLVKMPVPEKLPFQEITFLLVSKKLEEVTSFFYPVSHSTHNFYISGAKLARELSTIA